MDATEAILDSWDRQCRIVDAVASRINDSNRHLKPSDDGMPLDAQLAHMHHVRKFFLSQVAPEHATNLSKLYSDDQGTAIMDLNEIKSQLKASGKAVREAVREGMARGGGAMASEHVTYDNPVLLLQHMFWHDGWHIGLIFLALRLGGEEPAEEWEEPNVWGEWRKEDW